MLGLTCTELCKQIQGSRQTAGVRESRQVFKGILGKTEHSLGASGFNNKILYLIAGNRKIISLARLENASFPSSHVQPQPIVACEKKNNYSEFIHHYTWQKVLYEAHFRGKIS